MSSTPEVTIDDSDARRKRLENVKRKVSEAVKPEVLIEPVPEDPVLAAESVLGLVSDLEAQLSQSRELERSLRTELAEAKDELARTINDGRSSSGRLTQAETLLLEKRKVLEEMLFEMGALEQERDQAVRMVQLLTGKDHGRQAEFDELRNRCDQMQVALDESKAEEDRLNGELDDTIAENTRLHALLAEITRERDTLTRNVEKLIRERDELAQAKKALEKVHQALSQARARLRE
jgi:chromosome segregation ATPase